jgi:hypothetical protein
MDVAINDAKARISVGAPIQDVDGRVHCTVSFSRG